MERVPLETHLLSVGQLSARSGVAVSALHFYEAQGLIYAQRSPGNQRRYARETLRRVGFIRASQAVGIRLRAIKEALEQLPEGRTPTRADWARLSARWQTDLDQRISELQSLRDRLSDCIGCGCLSIDRCRLTNPGDILGSEGAGARRLLPAR
jgi:MerR family redox-sensitive transcriptional activator SoxR